MPFAHPRRYLALALAGAVGCQTAGGTNAVKTAAKPEADAARVEPAALVPALPVASGTTPRMQAGDFPPLVVPAPLGPPVTVSPPTAMGPPPSSAAPIQQVSTAPPQIAARVLATVNNSPILEGELREAVAQHLGELIRVPESQRGAKIAEIEQAELQRLIERELVLDDTFAKLKLAKTKAVEELKAAAAKEADKRLRMIRGAIKATSDDDFRTKLASQGLSEDGMRRQIERNYMMEECVRNIIFPVVKRTGLREVRDYYEEHADEFRIEDKLEWQDIFLDASRFPTPEAARQFAEHLCGRLRSGESFEALSAEFDHGDSKLRGGMGIGQKRGEVRPAEAEAVVFGLDAGQVGPVIDMGFGLHVVRCKTRQKAGISPFDAKVQADIRRKIEGVIAQREYKRIVEDLKQRYRDSIVVYKPQSG